MSYVVFARKWRPQDFGEVIGQEHITTTLKNAIVQDRAAHAYIFTGPRGIGKTSVARIFAKGLNCEKGPTPTPCHRCASCAGITSSNSLDVIEIDGASNNNVDQVRELRENIKFSPSYGRYKIYIIDEVHMLSIGAFNALLKTLEEPPSHAKFIFATTNAEKVPPTILSRCQRFDFRRIPLKLIVEKLKKITMSEKLKVSDEAVFAVARASDGSMRDAESVLDQLTSFCEKKIDQADVISLLGIIEEDRLSDMVLKICDKDTAGLLTSLDELITAGKDLWQLVMGLMGYMRNLMVLKVSADLSSLIDLPDEHIKRLKKEAQRFRIEEVLYIFYTLSATANAVKRSDIARFILEASLIKLALRDEMMSLSEIAEKVSRLENSAGYAETGSEEREPRGKNHRTEDDPPKEAPSGKNEDASEEAAPPAADAGSMVELTPGRVKRAWPQILDIIKRKKISLASYLLEGNIAEVKDPILILSFAKRSSLHREVLEQAPNKKMLEEVASQVLGRKVRFEFITAEETEAPAAREEKKVSDDSIVQSAMEMFDGRIIKRGYE